MSNEQNESFKKGFTFTQITEAEYEILDKQAKAEFRTLTAYLTIQIKKVAKKLKEQQTI